MPVCVSPSSLDRRPFLHPPRRVIKRTIKPASAPPDSPSARHAPLLNLYHGKKFPADDQPPHSGTAPPLPIPSTVPSTLRAAAAPCPSSQFRPPALTAGGPDSLGGSREQALERAVRRLSPPVCGVAAAISGQTRTSPAHSSSKAPRGVNQVTSPVRPTAYRRGEHRAGACFVRTPLQSARSAL